MDAFRGSWASTSTSFSTRNPHHQSRRYNNGNNHNQFSASNFFHSPLSTFFEYTGISRTGASRNSESSARRFTQNNFSGDGDNNGEISIRIIGGGEQEHRDGVDQVREGMTTQNETSIQPISRPDSAVVLDAQVDSRSDSGVNVEGNYGSGDGSVDVEASDGGAGVNNTRNSSDQRNGVDQATTWIEQVLPFILLLLAVFIRQHLQGLLVTISIAAFLFKSNDILRKQTALKGDRKISVLTNVSLFFTLYVAGVYWWYRKDDLLYPLLMLPPKNIPPFWHAIFIIVVNDILVRQAAMVVKCLLLMYYKNSKGLNYRKQGQMLRLVEYLLLLYRALLPVPVWYRFFLNEEYGSLFSALITGLYLTFKLTSLVEKVQSLSCALKALSHEEIHYGTYATTEQVDEGGEICAICQDKMRAPVMLCCKHIFCEDCVSEWLEREKTCPLCRAVVKHSDDLKSFADGSTTLSFQLF
ncbi:RING finger and transmembrane domain-containing protein 2-like [Cynara cardunculus var. scolymus]|uniref:RING finger and transmembrane domain-containing protein 2-like n=1 Tax=Cynara cardunculus var. scolymus TaxID=59895 RepID=UPI000D62BF38|nr:RING finger and transmembrane domain-containing protein 2-like [Cynara cardunculus var. scolymus]